MRLLPFIYCVVLTAALVALYISRHNQLIETRIRVLSLEKELRLEEAESARLELEIAMFVSPVRLEAIARKAQYAHLKQPSKDEVMSCDP